MGRPKKISLEIEQKKLKKIVEKLPAEKVELAEGLIRDAAFMLEQLDKLRTTIREAGVTEEYKHGREQYGFKETVEIGVYLKMQKNYAATIKQLNDMLPATPPAQAGAELAAFISQR